MLNAQQVNSKIICNFATLNVLSTFLHKDIDNKVYKKAKKCQN